jgi:hypothetical protein
MNYGKMNSKEACDTLHSIQGYLEKVFNKDIDNTLEVIIVPVQNQPTKVELLNSKYPNWEEFQERLPELMQQMEKFKNDKDI